MSCITVETEKWGDGKLATKPQIQGMTRLPFYFWVAENLIAQKTKGLKTLQRAPVLSILRMRKEAA